MDANVLSLTACRTGSLACTCIELQHLRLWMYWLINDTSHPTVRSLSLYLCLQSWLMLRLLRLTTKASSPLTIPRPYYLQVYPSNDPSEEALVGIKSLYFALMMSFGGDFRSSGAVPGVQVALDQINSDPTLLPGYQLHYTLTDSQVCAIATSSCW